MVTWDDDEDLDFAFQLQMQEAMAASRHQPQREERSTVSDPHMQQALDKFEQKRKDAEELGTELKRIYDDLKIQVHDQQFAQELHRMPEDQWQNYGNILQKPLVDSSSDDDAASDDDEGDGNPFILFSASSYNHPRVREVSETVSISRMGDGLIVNVQRSLMHDWRGDSAEEDLQSIFEHIASSVLQPEVEEKDTDAEILELLLKLKQERKEAEERRGLLQIICDDLKKSLDQKVALAIVSMMGDLNIDLAPEVLQEMVDETACALLERHGRDEYSNSDLEEVELLQKFQKELKDAEEREAAIQRVCSDLNIQSQDNVQKPFGRGSSSSSNVIINDKREAELRSIFNDLKIQSQDNAQIPFAQGSSSSNATINLQKPFGQGSSSSTAATNMQKPFGQGSASSTAATNMQNPFGQGSSSSTAASKMQNPFGQASTSSTAATKMQNPFGQGSSSSTAATKMQNPFGQASTSSTAATKMQNPFGQASSSSTAATKMQNPFGQASSSSSTAATKMQNPFGQASSSNAAIDDDCEPFRLYFKGLYNYARIGEDSKMVSVAAVGAAICDPHDNMILSVQKPLIGDWKSGWTPEDLEFKVEVTALIEGLNAALSMDVRRIDVFCDFYPLYHYITMKWLIKEEKIGTVVDQVCLLQRKFDSCRPFFVARNDVKFAFKLAREAIDTQITRSAESSRARSLKEQCSICLEDTDANQMFAVDGCLHRYCLSCMKQHVKVKLLHGVVPRCPHEGCNTQLGVPICRKFLSPELIDLMNQLIKEESIPVTERVYCPYPKCSKLMSKADLLQYTDAVFIEWTAVHCIQCHGLFCINCVVPWHNNMSCHEYKRLNPNPSAEDAKLESLASTNSWRQCTSCKRMIELAEGCYHITCRCGYEFCYTCGAEWKNRKATCNCPIWDERYILNDPGSG